MRFRRAFKLLVVVVSVTLISSQFAVAQDTGFVPLFNGKDLTGWVNVNCDPSTFFVKDGMIVTTGKPIGFLRTDKQYENFVLEVDWMHQNKVEPGNSGLFVWGDPLPAKGIGYTRGIEVQVLVNAGVKDKYTSHGDIFSIHGATCKPDRPHPFGMSRCLPSENRCKGGGEWNHYKVVANDGVIKLEVNGKEVSGVSECNPRKGYLALESEGAECWFKNITIKELPSTNPNPEQVADLDKGFKSMYHGLNLNGWKADEGVKQHWKTQGTRLTYDGKGDGKKQTLWTEKDYSDFEIVFDWKAAPKREAAILFQGPDGPAPFKLAEHSDGKLHRIRLKVKNGRLMESQVDNRLIPIAVDSIRYDPSPRGPIGLSIGDGPAEFANLFIRELK